ncbi:hypothetical protein BDF20DRAFT_838649 [Mycotypha africana]|uniref:uncharacterized protein n=1 Tax=Mycotypha africana TaxID=64632 RepID=UPI002300AD47|nr:uncharacterized protein BDF20DRAFT_838649 [Mycotypha africana]KAI8970279.1 hypothetical protein BDF20DRAFT_838649 [Mycotypha africana]
MSTAHIFVPVWYIAGLVYVLVGYIDSTTRNSRPSYNESAEVRVKGTFTQINSLTSFHRSNRSRHRYSMMNRAVTIGLIGRASDSKSEGQEFNSLTPHFCTFNLYGVCSFSGL